MKKPSKPPIVSYRKAEPLLDYYLDRKGDRYSVARLVEETKDLTPFLVPLAALDLSDIIWHDATIFDLGFHMRKVAEADLRVPIILDWEGAIADGRHRVIKALAEDRREILAVRMHWKIEPDRAHNG